MHLQKKKSEIKYLSLVRYSVIIKIHKAFRVKPFIISAKFVCRFMHVGKYIIFL